MDGIQVFSNSEFGQIRAIKDESGDPLFIAVDVCQALGLGQVTNALRRLDDDERTLISIKGHDVNAVNESGLYSLVLSSRKPEAKAFKRWVTHEVLPAIRKDGGYMVARDETPEETMARAVIMAQSTMERQKARIAAQEAEIAELRPKAFFADAVAASDGTCLVGELAKMLRQAGVPDMGQNRLFERLRRDGFLIGGNRSDRNMPTQRSVELGLFKIKETVVVHSDGHSSISKTPKITQKGVRYLFDCYSTEAAYA